MGAKLPPVDLGAGHTAKAVAVGTEHVCAILDDDSVRCWGNGGEGRLGLGDTSHRGDQPGEMGDKLPPVDLGPGHTAKAIAAGAMHSCAILDDDSVRCWGYGAEGQLFNGNPGFDVGDGPGEMGAALSPAPLGTGRTARGIALGYVHTCILLDNSKVKCLGANNNGRLGFGDTASHQDLIGDDLPPVDLGLDALSLAAGANFTCTILSDHSSKCWGENFDGWLGLGDTNHRGDDQGEMGAKLPVISLGNGLAPTSLFAGAFHTCALFGEEKLKCWGSNSNGTLGLGDSNPRGDQPGEMGEKLPFVSF
jgi:alpha-tubulin suppressor-like RCC1 family protein